MVDGVASVGVGVELVRVALAAAARVVEALDIVAADAPGVTAADLLAATTAVDGDTAACGGVAPVASPGLEAGGGGQRSKESDRLDEQHVEE